MTQPIYLYVFDSMSDWEYGYLVAELHSGRFFKQDVSPCHIMTVGNGRQPITTMGGLKIVPNLTVEDMSLRPNDLLILPGGQTWGETIHHPLLQHVKEALHQGTWIAAICGATEGLAARGMLDSRRHTSNDLAYLQQMCPTYRGESLYENHAVVRDGNLITASGFAPLEFARETIAALAVFSEDVLDNWYLLNQTRDTAYFFKLMNLVYQPIV